LTPFPSLLAASLILAVVLAVARDVPILNLLAIPRVNVGDVVPCIFGFTWLVLLVVGWGPSHSLIAPWCQAGAWVGALAYFWWSVVWKLREGR
jgi:hypothetical protein